ncbi:hypothetical protein CK203_020908 [Vitis vinifera]|uniref:Uncharacterized protein n=1 Tax=Vitis vinifera TaxID=29760 RepID=A0A438JWR9_VITVI|nr:hypothetical protein CK203_020908 [Vitis vinifera]
MIAHVFEAMSKLSINLDKSKLIPIERVENLEELALEFGCKVGALPSSYMGFPLGGFFYICGNMGQGGEEVS